MSYIIAEPTIYPVTLAEAKVHLRVNAVDANGELLPNEDDGYIQELIAVATASVENATHHLLSNRLITWNRTTDLDSLTIRLDYTGSTVEIVTVSVNDEVTTDYIVTYSSPMKITINNASVNDDIRITYTLPDSEVANIPRPLKQAILFLIANMYEQRQSVLVGQSVVELPKSHEYLIKPYVSYAECAI